MQCACWYDGGAGRDIEMINPCFKVVGTGADADALVNDLANVISGFVKGGPQIRVRAYDLQGTPPVYPAAEKILNVGSSPVSSTIREPAICLSFRNGPSRPRRRGRLYIPFHWTTTGASLGPRPSSPQMVYVTNLVSGLTGLGGINVDWIVWSKLDRAGYPVTDWWVDDEWDAQRRRGLKPSTKITGTTTEGDIPNIVRLGPAPTEINLEDLSGAPAPEDR
jgi:hypothetical protein